MEPLYLEVREGYDLWSAIYDEELNPLVAAESPVVRGWLPHPAGLEVADVGCGTGRHARWLAEAGARVTAFDLSQGMMSRARARLEPLGVRLVEHALPRPLPVADRAFDRVLLALVADHLADLPAAFRELFRVTRPGGETICTVLHPAMNLVGITARFSDPANGREVRVAAFEHSFGDYLMAMLRAGFAVEAIVERRVDAALIAEAPRAGKYPGWPLLLAVRLKRC